MDAQTKQTFKSLLYEQFARIGKAFGNGKRLEVIDLLAQSEHTVEDLAMKTGIPIASVSQHLQVLKNARLVDVRREGTYAWYFLRDDDVFRLWATIREIALQRLADIDQLMRDYVAEREQLETITAEELLRRIREDSITILDARPVDEYEAGHIPDAISIPLDQLETMIDNLPSDQEIVAYCRASYCLLSDEVALLLQEMGYSVRVLDEGFPEWKVQELPFETGNNDT